MDCLQNRLIFAGLFEECSTLEGRLQNIAGNQSSFFQFSPDILILRIWIQYSFGPPSKSTLNCLKLKRSKRPLFLLNSIKWRLT